MDHKTDIKMFALSNDRNIILYRIKKLSYATSLIIIINAIIIFITP